MALLELLKRPPCRMMVSGYPSALYDERLAGGRSLSLQVMNRARHPRHIMVAQMVSLKRVARSLRTLTGRTVAEAPLLGHVAKLHHALAQ